MDIAKTAGKAMLGGGGDKGGLSVDTELVVGDKTSESKVDVQAGSRTENHTQAENVVNNFIADMKPIHLIIMILGWMAPCPSTIYKEIKHLTKTALVGLYNGLTGLLRAAWGR